MTPAAGLPGTLVRRMDSPPSADLLVIMDGLAEPLSGSTTLAEARTPCLDRLAGMGSVFRIDPQENAPSDRISSERGIALLLGATREESCAISRASLLSLLAEERRSLMVSGPSPERWVFLATPVSLDAEDRLVRYVNGSAAERKFWRFLRERLPGHSPFQLLRVGTGTETERVLLGVPGVPENRREGAPPRRGLHFLESASFEPFFSWIETLRNAPGASDAFSLSDEAHSISRVWLWGGGPGISGTSGAASGGPARAVVSATPLVRATGLWRGYDSLSFFGGTGDVDTDLGAKIGAVMRAFGEWYRSVVLHLEGFDMASHRRDRAGKVRFLERVDREVTGRILEAFTAGLLTSIRVTSDHQSSPVSGNHESGPVPALFVARNAPEVLPGQGSSLASMSGIPARRMTEGEARRSPFISMDRWNVLPLRQSLRVANDSGKVPCRALS